MFRVNAKISFLTALVFLLDCSKTIAAEVNFTLSGRIVGGTEAPVGRYPTYAWPQSSYLCGSVLIWNDILVTAAHCANAFTGKVWMGGIDRRGVGASKYDTSTKVVHPSYAGNSQNDIMLVKLKSNATVQPSVVNWNRSLPLDNQLLTVIGYGVTTERGNISNKLLQVDLPTTNSATCKAKYQRVEENLTICAGYQTGGKDSCQGDSGGPLFLKGTNIVAALVSSGAGCARPGIPSLNVRMSNYKQWIDSTICAISSFPPKSCKATKVPTKKPTKRPTMKPTKVPTKKPTLAPTRLPTRLPTMSPTKPPTSVPTKTPTEYPTIKNTLSSTEYPTKGTTNEPTNEETQAQINRPIAQRLVGGRTPTTETPTTFYPTVQANLEGSQSSAPIATQITRSFAHFIAKRASASTGTNKEKSSILLRGNADNVGEKHH